MTSDWRGGVIWGGGGWHPIYTIDDKIDHTINSKYNVKKQNLYIYYLRHLIRGIPFSNENLTPKHPTIQILTLKYLHCPVFKDPDDLMISCAADDVQEEEARKTGKKKLVHAMYLHEYSIKDSA